ncbi:MAG: hypothetical protein HQL32_00075 [Planctomycetes bacterium]|nr:hypothetical protein [Planctomycetota bacterium]
MSEQWQNLVDLFPQVLSLIHQGKKADGLAIHKLAQKNGLAIPPWFQGVGRGFQKCQLKLQHKLELFCASEMAEMGSSWQVAKARYELLKPHWQKVQVAYLPCCGAGLDALHLLSQASGLGYNGSLILSDIYPVAAKMAAYNMAAYKMSDNNTAAKKMSAYKTAINSAEGNGIQAQVLVEDFLQPGHERVPRESYVFLDPARRSEGQRLKDDYLPPLKSSMQQLELFLMAQIKLSPGENIQELVMTHPSWSWTVIQAKGEIKEVCGTYVHPSITNAGSDGVKAIITRDNGENCYFKQLHHSLRPEGTGKLKPGQVLALAAPALVKSQLLEDFASHHKLCTYDASPGILLIPDYQQSPEGPWLDTFTLLGECSRRPKEIRSLLKPYEGRPLELRAMGDSSDAELMRTLKTYLSQKGSADSRLVLVTVKLGKSRRCLLLESLRNPK